MNPLTEALLDAIATRNDVETYAKVKDKPGQQDLFSGQKRRSSKTQAKLRWITIGSEDHHGGTHVQIDSKGNIAAGPAALTGKNLGDLKKESKGRDHEDEKKPAAKKKESEPGKKTDAEKEARAKAFDAKRGGEVHEDLAGASIAAYKHNGQTIDADAAAKRADDREAAKAKPAKAEPEKGSWEHDVDSKWQRNFVTPALKKIEKKPWQTSAEVSDSLPWNIDNKVRTVADILREDDGTQIAWNEAGEPHYAPAGAEVPEHLATQEQIDAAGGEFPKAEAERETSDFDVEQAIKISADDVSKLRKPDVYRVLEWAPAENRQEVADHITENRPELADEVAESMEDLADEPVADSGTAPDDPQAEQQAADEPQAEAIGDEDLKSMDDDLKQLNKSNAKLEKMSEANWQRLKTQGRSRGQSTTYAARSGQEAELRDRAQESLNGKVRGHIAAGRDVPQEHLDALGRTVDYDENGNYSPVEKPEAKAEAKRAETYFKGDRAESTGGTKEDNGDTLHEWEMMEGHRKGEKIHSYTRPSGVNPVQKDSEPASKEDGPKTGYFTDPTPTPEELNEALKDVKGYGAGQWASGPTRKEKRDRGDSDWETFQDGSLFKTKYEAVAQSLRALRAKATKDKGLEPGDYPNWDGNFRDIASESELKKIFPPEEMKAVLNDPISMSEAIDKSNAKNEPEGGWSDADKVPDDQQSATKEQSNADQVPSDRTDESGDSGVDQRSVEKDIGSDSQAEAKPATGRGTVSDLSGFNTFLNDMRDGNITIDELKAGYKDFRENKDTFIGAITKKHDAKRMKHIAAQFGVWDAGRNSKAANAEAIHDRILSHFDPTGKPLQFSPFGYGEGPKNPAEAMDERMKEITQEDLQANQDRRTERNAQEEKTNENPETIAELTANARSVGGYHKMKPEHQAAYDDLKAEQSRGQRKTEQQPTTVTATITSEEDHGGFALTKNYHSKRGTDIFTASPANRVERDQYKEMNTLAKQLGGWYYKAFNGTPGGFHFPTEEKREQFTKAMAGETVDRSEHLAEKTAAKAEKKAETLGEYAKRLEDDASGRLNQDRKTNTHKRAGEAASAHAAAHSDITKARTLGKIADAVASGEAKHLDGVKTGTHYDELRKVANAARRSSIEAGLKEKYGDDWRQQAAHKEMEDSYSNGEVTAEHAAHAKMPNLNLYKNSAGGIIAEAAKTPGLKQEAAKWAKVLNGSSHDDHFTALNGSQSAAFVDFVQKAKKKGLSQAKDFDWHTDSFKRMRAMGLHNDHEVRAAMREFVGLQNGSKSVPTAAEKDKATEAAIIQKHQRAGFFPTPKSVISEMLDHAEIDSGHSVLEPSAGLGHILDAVTERHGSDVTQHGVEQSHELAEHIKSKGHSVDHGDFLEHTGQYDRVLMNPPFEKDQAIDHVRHAFEQLKPGGKLVAVVPGNERLYSEGKGKRSDFHGWASTHGDFHELPDNAFAGDDSVRKTGVKTSLLVMRKPETGSEEYSRGGEPFSMGLLALEASLSAAIEQNTETYARQGGLFDESKHSRDHGKFSSKPGAQGGLFDEPAPKRKTNKELADEHFEPSDDLNALSDINRMIENSGSLFGATAPKAGKHPVSEIFPNYQPGVSPQFTVGSSGTLIDETGEALRVYHGTDVNGVDQLEPDHGKDTHGEFGIYTTPNQRQAKGYGKNLHSSHVEVTNPLFVENKGEISSKNLTREDVQQLQQLGYDAIIVTKYQDPETKQKPEPLSKASEVVLFHGAQFRSNSESDPLDGRRAAGLGEKPAPAPKAGSGIAGQQMGLFHGHESAGQQKSLFNVVKPHSKKQIRDKVQASLLETIEDNLKASGKESLGGQKDLFSMRNAFLMEQYAKSMPGQKSLFGDTGSRSGASQTHIEWSESKHTRASDGRFGNQAGQHTAKPEPPKKSEPAVAPAKGMQSPAKDTPAAAPTAPAKATPPAAAQPQAIEAGHTFKAHADVPMGGSDYMVKSIEGGKATVSDGYSSQSMPVESLSHFVNDMQGRVNLPGLSGNASVDAVLSGKAKFLGKGDDGLVFDDGNGNAVKVSTTVPYIWSNHFHRSPAESAAVFRKQTDTGNEMLDAGVPGIMRQETVEHGGKVFAVRPMVDIPETLTPDQLAEARASIEAMHAKGYSVNDQIQIGIGKDGKAYQFDTGKADKLPEKGNARKYAIEDDISSLKRLYQDSGQKYDDPKDPQQAFNEYEPVLLDTLNKMEAGEPMMPGIAKRQLKKLTEGYAKLLSLDPDGVITFFDEDHPKAVDYLRQQSGGLPDASAPLPAGTQAVQKHVADWTPDQKSADWKTNGVTGGAFKNWFGDWENDFANSSKVINENREPQSASQVTGADGKPISVYHGTAKGGFQSFEKRWGETTGGSDGEEGLLYGPGMYFTENQDIATEYSNIDQGTNENANREVKEVFLNIRNAYDPQQTPTASEWTPQFKQAMLHKTNEQIAGALKEAAQTRIDVEQARKETPQDFAPGGEWEGSDIDYLKDADRMEKWAQDKQAQINAGNTDAAISHQSMPKYGDIVHAKGSKAAANEWLRSMGYDGITHEGGDVMGGGKHHRVWIAFEPNQIKSTDNEGTFDANDDRMKYSRSSAPGQMSMFGETGSRSGRVQSIIEWDEEKHPRDEAGKFAEVESHKSEPTSKSDGPKVELPRAKAGGQRCTVTGEWFEGGQIMPTHGLSQKQEAKPSKGDGSGDITPRAEDGKGRGPRSRGVMSPEDVEAERERRQEQRHWDKVQSGPVADLLWFGDKPGRSGFNVKKQMVPALLEMTPEQVEKVGEYLRDNFFEKELEGETVDDETEAWIRSDWERMRDDNAGMYLTKKAQNSHPALAEAVEGLRNFTDHTDVSEYVKLNEALVSILDDDVETYERAPDTWTIPSPARETQVRPQRQTVAAEKQKPARQPGDGTPGWQKVGGSNVFVDGNGKVTKGCPGLKGEHVSDLIDESDDSREVREVRQSHAKAEGITGENYTAKDRRRHQTQKAADQHAAAKEAAAIQRQENPGVSTSDVLRHMPQAKELERESTGPRDELRKLAREYTGWTQGKISRAENSQLKVRNDGGSLSGGGDYAGNSKFEDSAANFVVDNRALFNEVFGNVEQHYHAETVWNLIGEGGKDEGRTDYTENAKAASQLAAHLKSHPTMSESTADDGGDWDESEFADDDGGDWDESEFADESFDFGGSLTESLNAALTDNSDEAPF